MLSVIIPFYNAKPWLKECVASIVAALRSADKMADAEIVLVDDGSDDGTNAPDFPGLTRLIKCSENHGVAAARQIGLDAARGDWIAWVDADDTVRENWAAAIFSVIDRVPAPDVLQFDAEATRQNGKTFRISYRRASGEVDARTFRCDVLKNVRTCSWLWNRIFRRSLFDGITFEADLGRGGKEDFMVLALVLARAERVEYMPDILYNYRMHEGSLARFSNGPDYLRRIKAINAFVENLEPPTARRAAEFGAAVMFADYCRCCGVPKGWRGYLVRHLPLVLMDRDASLLNKIKYCLAVVFHREIVEQI